MAYETKELSGSMFKNRKKEKPNHPDLTGEAKIDGKIYWVSGWKKQDKNGDTWISFALKEKDFTEAKKAVQGHTPQEQEDTIPFSAVNVWAL